MAPEERQTAYWKVDKNRPASEIIRQAGIILRCGGLVAFPTETVYGLGANALDGAAVRGVFSAKGRPLDNPLIVHIAGLETVFEHCPAAPEKALLLMERFWPGPLAVVLRGGGKIPPEVTAGLSSVAFRMPDHPVALGLIREAGVPVAAPSANISGRPSPTTADHVYSDLGGRIDVILDGGPAGMGVESTVLDMTGEVPVILRPGGVTPEEIEEIAGAVALDPSLTRGGKDPQRPRSPGMKYRHYAPSAPLLLVEGDPVRVVLEIKRLAAEYTRRGEKVGVICRSGNLAEYRDVLAVPAGEASDQASVAAALYGALRRFEGSGVDVILAEGVEPRGLGLAVANRLRRAAGGSIVRVR